MEAAGNTVTSIVLPQNNLTGTIPSELGNLSNLKRLDFRLNNLTGTIPSELGDLGSLLLELSLNRNQLTGTIPSELGKLDSLLDLYLSRNELTGTIPSELGDLSSLLDLYLSRNELTGTIPSELGGLSSLQVLGLDQNQLTGTIPSELGDLGSLQYLLLSQNQLTGTIPSQLGDLGSLRRLYLNQNQLTGTIPTELGDMEFLQRLHLQDTMLSGGTALIEKIEQTDFNGLEELGLWGNDDLTGAARQASDDLGKRIDRAALRVIYEETSGDNWKNKNNWLSTGSTLFTFSDWYGVETNNSGRVSKLELINNNLAGELTNAIEALHNLVLIDLSTNRLSGTIPSEIGTLTNLGKLKFSYNQLTGTIPAELGNLTGMARLRLNNNLLSGAIPSEIGTLTDLWQLKLNDNRLSCDIPDLSSINGIMVELQNNRHLGGTLSANLVGNWDDRFLLDISCTGIETPDTTAFEGWLNGINLFRSGRSDCKLEVMPSCSPGVIDRVRVTGVTLVEGVEELSVSWEEFPGASGYRVQWKSGAQIFASTRQHTITSGSTTTYTIPNLTAGTRYTIRVIAIVSNSVPSEEVTGIPTGILPPPPPPPPPPPSPTIGPEQPEQQPEDLGQVTGVEVTEELRQLSVSWEEFPGASGYRVQWKSGALDFASTRQHTVPSGSTTTYAIPNLTAGTLYTIRVIAIVSTADSPPSEEVTGTPGEELRPIPGTEQRSGGGCAIGSVVPGEVSQSALFNMLVVMSALFAASRRKNKTKLERRKFLDDSH